MTGVFDQPADAVPIQPNAANDAEEMAELRRLIVQADEVGEVLPKAVKRTFKKDTKLADATLPLVEENIRQSVKQNPQVLAEALFPAIGPAIRKAISEALSQMVQSLNQTLENSVSPRGLGWRLEAWRTGKSFGEVVMLHSLVYRVEEVFLIHKETGLLLEHVSAKADVAKDADMVSAMLTAIQDFARDSFKGSEDATLDSMQLNDLSVWIERGPDAVLAGVIRGNAPLVLRDTFKEAIEEIHYNYGEDLDNYSGDAEVFAGTRPALDRCLQYQLSDSAKETKKTFTPARIMAGVLGLLVLVTGFFYIRDYMRWNGYLSDLKAQPGIVVTDARRGFFKHSISGLRDPMAADPTSFLATHSYDAGDVESKWNAYYDLTPEMAVKRAENALSPPDGVKFSFENGTLTATGNASPEWAEKAHAIAATLPGVTDFRIMPLDVEMLKLKIEARKIRFNCGTADFAADSAGQVSALSGDLERLIKLGDGTQSNARFEILGFADQTGRGDLNSKLSQARADKLRSELLNRSAALSEFEKSGQAAFKASGMGAGNDVGCAATVKVE